MIRNRNTQFKMLVKFVLLLTLAALVVNGQDTCKEEYLDMVGFNKIGTYKGTTSCGQTYAKTYYVSQNFKVFGSLARSVCVAFGMDSLSLETLDEMNNFFALCDKNVNFFEDYTHIGGYTNVGRSIDKWYWLNSGKRVDYKMKFTPGQPDFSGNLEFCLGIHKKPNDFSFFDLYCSVYHEFKFVCQRIDF